MNVGERIKTECNRHGKAVSWVEKDLGLANGYIHNLIVRGSSPSADRLQKMADYFGCTPEYLLGVEDVKYSAAQIADRVSRSEKLLELFERTHDASDETIKVLLAVLDVIG